LAPGDEVIMPSFTFVSTANAVARLGARPAFVDIRRDTLNIDETLIEAAITDKTKAIFPVHYAGVGCRMEEVLAIARRYDLRVVEDAAHGLGAVQNGRALGSIGDLGTFSFHETKNLTCGEGGALCVNDPALLEAAEILRDKGTNRRQYLRGQVDKYTWVNIGSSYVPSEICAAFLYAQLEMMDQINESRRRSYEFYRNELRPLEDEGLLRLPHIPADCESNCHLFYVILPHQSARDALLNHLQTQQILAVFHYVPLHSSPMGMSYGCRDGDLPVTEDMSRRLLRLPLYHEITMQELLRVVQQIRSHLRRAPARVSAA
jgi:dTDP-4-amino-4,6-dideoxygalactose transaminase